MRKVVNEEDTTPATNEQRNVVAAHMCVFLSGTRG